MSNEKWAEIAAVINKRFDDLTKHVEQQLTKLKADIEAIKDQINEHST